MGKKGNKGKKGAASKPNSNGKNGSYYAALDNNNDTTDGPARNTRGRKNNHHKGRGRRHVNSNAVYDERLRESIEADGSKSVIEMAADGNCLFRSLSDQLYHDYGNRHDDVRAEVCDLLEAHEEEFSVFLVLDEEEDDEDAADFSSYVDQMRQSGEWGGNVELVVAARLYRRNITVFSSSLAAFTIDHGHANKQPAGPDVLLSFHENDHYNSVRDNTRGKPPTPIKTFNAASPPQQLSKIDDAPEEEGKEEHQSTPATIQNGATKKSKKMTRKEKRQARRNGEDGRQMEDSNHKDEPQMAGDFRVLKI